MNILVLLAFYIFRCMYLGSHELNQSKSINSSKLYVSKMFSQKTTLISTTYVLFGH